MAASLVRCARSVRPGSKRLLCYKGCGISPLPTSLVRHPGIDVDREIIASRGRAGGCSNVVCGLAWIVGRLSIRVAVYTILAEPEIPTFARIALVFSPCAPAISSLGKRSGLSWGSRT